jgi:hypothetical protein
MPPKRSQATPFVVEEACLRYYWAERTLVSPAVTVLIPPGICFIQAIEDLAVLSVEVVAAVVDSLTVAFLAVVPFTPTGHFDQLPLPANHPDF